MYVYIYNNYIHVPFSPLVTYIVLVNALIELYYQSYNPITCI